MGRTERIQDALLKRPRHVLVEKDQYRISERIREIDSGYFILMDNRDKTYEVHNTENDGATYCFTSPYKSLDKRTLTYCRETAVERDVGSIIEKYNEMMREQQERKNKADIKDRTRYVADETALSVDRDMMHSSYARTHYMRGTV